MRRRQFVQLIYDLRAELERAVDPAAGVADIPILKRAIQRNYESLYDAYDWPHLTVTASVSLVADSRYYDFPSEIDYDKIDEIRLFWNDRPTDICRGISLDDMAVFDSDAEETSDPAQKWDVRFTGTREQMEVWPIPASSGDSIKFKGKKKFVQLIDEANLCLIDDHLVVLSSAIELLPEKSGAKLKAKLAALQARYGVTRGRAKSGSETVRVGLGGTGKPYGQGITLRVGG